MDVVEITVSAELVMEFRSFSHWVNAAATSIGHISKNEKVICLDKNNRVLTCGGDMQIAWEKDCFPVKAYRLLRNIEFK